VRAVNERRVGMISLSYGNGRTVRVPKGLSVLEASLRNNVPHASVCGGRARCSTCRIRVIGDCTSLPQPSQRRRSCSTRVGAGSDPAIRLACQLRPEADLSFFQIFLPQITAATLRTTSPARIGEERYLVSMFVDMRGSTRLAENRLPFDTVFIVNRFPRRGVEGCDRMRRSAQPVRRRRAIGAVRTQLQPANRLPPGTSGRGDDCRQCRRIESVPSAMICASRSASASASMAAKSSSRYRLPRSHGIHGTRRRGQCRSKAAGHDKEASPAKRSCRRKFASPPAFRPMVWPEQEVAIRGRAEPMIVRSVADASALSALVNDVQIIAA